MRRHFVRPPFDLKHVFLFLLCLGWSHIAWTQTVSGQARVVRALLPGNVVIVADTGNISYENDARTARPSGAHIHIGSLGRAQGAQATAISSFSDRGQDGLVTSNASLADLELNIAGNTIVASFIETQVTTTMDGPGAANSVVDGLVINGQPFSVPSGVTGEIPLNGGRIIVNEFRESPGGAAITALHVQIYGVADIAVASAAARILPDEPSISPGTDALDAFATSTAPFVGVAFPSTTSVSDSTLPSSTSLSGSLIP